MMENQVASRLRPLQTTACRNRPSYRNPSRSTAARNAPERRRGARYAEAQMRVLDSEKR